MKLIEAYEYINRLHGSILDADDTARHAIEAYEYINRLHGSILDADDTARHAAEPDEPPDSVAWQSFRDHVEMARRTLCCAVLDARRLTDLERWTIGLEVE